MRTAIWWFLFSVYTATGSTVDFQFVGFDTEEECETFRDALTQHARAHVAATRCQWR